MSTTVSGTTINNPYAVSYSSNDLAGTDTTASKYSSTSGTNKSGSSSSSGSYSQSIVSQMSGLDTNSMVNESMASDVIKLNSLLAKQQQSQWIQDRYRSIITNFQSFNSKYFDVLSSNYVLSPNSFSVNTATSSNTNFLDTTALNTAKTGTYIVTSATIATSSNVTSGVLSNTSGNKAAASDAISSMGVASGTLSFLVDGKNVSYNLNSNSSISKVMQDLSSLTGMNFNYSELTGKFSVSTQKTGDNQNVDIQNISDGANFFSKFGLTVNGGAIATADTAIAIGSSAIKNMAASASDKISDTSLKLTNGDTLSFTINGAAKTYTVDTSKSIGTLMSDLSSLTGSNFSYNSSTGQISAEAAGSPSLNISYNNGSSAQTFFNDAFGMAAGSTSMTSVSGTSKIVSSGVIENPSKNANASGSDAISVTGLNAMFGTGTTKTTLSIGGKTVTVDASESINKLMSDLSSASGTTFRYDNSTGKVSIEQTGTTSFDIQCDDSTTQTFFNNYLGIGTTADIKNSTSSTAVGKAGKDGTFYIKEPGNTDATSVKESSNNFTIDGVAYSFSSDVDASNPIAINVKQDVSSVVDKIQGFVNDYNNLIDGIQTVTNEKRNYTYSPLTSSQEAQMTDSQITAWNQKAQQGLLQNDSELTDMLSTMREAFYTPVNGNGLTMAGVGLSTSDDPKQGGKLTLDVKKLTTALQNNPQQVVSLFTQTSTSYPSYTGVLNIDTSTDGQAVSKAMAQRNREEGIFQRLSDIEQKYAGTYVDKNGNQGLLLMKAGMPNTLSETNNSLYKELKNETDAVSNFKKRMTSDAKMYQQKFSALQTALSQLSTQQNYLTSMLSSSSS